MLTLDQPITLTNLLLGPVGSYVAGQASNQFEPIESVFDVLDSIFDLTIESLDSDDDGDRDPLFRYVPVDTTIAGDFFTQGISINGAIDAWGYEGELIVDIYNSFIGTPSIEGSLSLEKIDFGGDYFALQGQGGDDIEFAWAGTPTDLHLNGDVELILFGHNVASTSVNIGFDRAEMAVNLDLFNVLEIDGELFIGNSQETEVSEGSYDNATGTYQLNTQTETNSYLTLAGEDQQTSLLFDGVDDSVTVNSETVNLTNNDFTLEVWIKTDHTGSQDIIVKDDGDGVYEAGEKRLFMLGNGTVAFAGRGNGRISGSTAINDGKWHHIAVVWDYQTGTNGTGKIYLDGVEDTDLETYGLYAANNQDNSGDSLKLGASVGNNPFAGELDELRFWSKTRTQAEIQVDMNQRLNGDETGLDIYLPIEESDRGSHSTLSTTSYAKGGEAREILNLPLTIESGIINPSNNGLILETFNNANLEGDPVKIEQVNQVSVSDSGEASYRWSGYIEAPVTGTYTFKTTAEHGARLVVDDFELIDNWQDATTVWEGDGNNDYWKVQDYLGSYELREEWTIEAWVRPDSSGPNDYQKAPIIWKHGDGSEGHTFGLGWENNKFVAGYRKESNNNHIKVSSNSHSSGQFYHVAAVAYRDGNNNNQGVIKIYVNGVLEGTINNIGNAKSNGGDKALTIGGNTNKENVSKGIFDGAIDEVRVWDKRLTTSEIEELADQTKEVTGDEDGLMGYWDFENAQGTTVYDRTPTKNSGYIEGDPDVEWNLKSYTSDYSQQLTSGSSITETATIELEAGELYPIVLESPNYQSGANVNLSWAYPGQSLPNIPGFQFGLETGGLSPIVLGSPNYQNGATVNLPWPYSSQVLQTIPASQFAIAETVPEGWTINGGEIGHRFYGTDEDGAFEFTGTDARNAISPAVNVSQGGYLHFDLIWGGDVKKFRTGNNVTENNGGSPAEDGDNIVLQYSINDGVNWTQIKTYQRSDYGGEWNPIKVSIPASAQTEATRFRWKQNTFNSGALEIAANINSDFWALDNVDIVTNVDIITEDQSQIAHWSLGIDDWGDNKAKNEGSLGNAVNGTYKNFPSLIGGFTNLDLVDSLVLGGDGAVKFNGNDQGVLIPDHSSINTGGPYAERTIELWFKADNVNGTQVLFEEGGTAGGLNIYLDNDQLNLGVWRSNQGQWLSETVQAKEIYHVVLTFDDGQLTGYLNGGEIGSVAAGFSTIPSHSGDIAIAQRQQDTRFSNSLSVSGNGDYFDGVIDDVALYDIALSPEEVAEKYIISSGNDIIRSYTINGAQIFTPDITNDDAGPNGQFTILGSGEVSFLGQTFSTLNFDITAQGLNLELDNQFNLGSIGSVQTELDLSTGTNGIAVTGELDLEFPLKVKLPYLGTIDLPDFGVDGELNLAVATDGKVSGSLKGIDFTVWGKDISVPNISLSSNITDWDDIVLATQKKVESAVKNSFSYLFDTFNQWDDFIDDGLIYFAGEVDEFLDEVTDFEGFANSVLRGTEQAFDDVGKALNLDFNSAKNTLKKFFNGYVSGGTIFIDENGNLQLDPGELFAITDDQGNFSLDYEVADYDIDNNSLIEPSEAMLVSFGGIDSTTGLPMAIPFISTVDGNISPLTTIEMALVNQGVAQETAAEIVQNSFGFTLSDEENLAELDPYEELALGNDIGVEIAINHIRAHSLMLIGSELVAASQSDLSSVEVTREMLSSLATELQSFDNLDLNNAAQVRQIINAWVETEAGINDEALTAITNLITAGNQELESLVNSEDQELDGIVTNTYPLKKIMIGDFPSIVENLIDGSLESSEAVSYFEQLVSIAYENDDQLFDDFLSNDTLTGDNGDSVLSNDYDLNNFSYGVEHDLSAIEAGDRIFDLELTMEQIGLGDFMTYDTLDMMSYQDNQTLMVGLEPQLFTNNNILE
ncbi:MAG: LamG-like jellyroll fold domain-containing protein [Cyanobacteria bacterium P01_F01_bin.143]